MAALRMNLSFILGIGALCVHNVDALNLLNASKAGAKRSHLRVHGHGHTHNKSGGNASSKPALPLAKVAPPTVVVATTATDDVPTKPEVASMADVQQVKELQEIPLASSVVEDDVQQQQQQMKDTHDPGAIAMVSELPPQEVDVQQIKDTPAPSSAMVSQLQQELQEVKQHRANIVQLQQALTADVALLREGSALQRASATQHSRTAAQIQVRKTERIVKDLSSMLRESREGAVEDANALFLEATEVRTAANALASEASAQLLALAPTHRSHHSREVAKKKPVEQPAEPEPVSQPALAAAANSRLDTAPASKPMAAVASESTTDDDVDDVES